ncbi:hypothetical protein [Novipirellula aureliae]|uniref:hypothetical protein n=1 Tax=Novipirellula aureliae TaxID=2527966 RepID=UPI0018CF8348|nr:hypothetical protein [Novipirellula aureliae]
MRELPKAPGSSDQVTIDHDVVVAIGSDTRVELHIARKQLAINSANPQVGCGI